MRTKRHPLLPLYLSAFAFAELLAIILNKGL